MGRATTTSRRRTGASTCVPPSRLSRRHVYPWPAPLTLLRRPSRSAARIRTSVVSPLPRSSPRDCLLPHSLRVVCRARLPGRMPLADLHILSTSPSRTTSLKSTSAQPRHPASASDNHRQAAYRPEASALRPSRSGGGERPPPTHRTRRIFRCSHSRESGSETSDARAPDLCPLLAGCWVLCEL